MKIKAQSDFIFETALTDDELRQLAWDFLAKFSATHASVLESEVFFNGPGNISIKVLLNAAGFGEAETTVEQLARELGEEIARELRHPLQNRAMELIPA